MNGDWYPWCEGVNSNAPGDYVKAWRHVHDLFEQEGATNATWVWCVNKVYSGSTPIGGLYPGDNYVDWISLDSYNRLASTWQDFSTLSDATCSNLIAIAPGKPIMVAEAGCNEEAPHDKGQWFINALANYLKWSMPRIKAWVYFDGSNPDGNDWHIDTSTNSIAGYRFGITLSYYASNRFGALASMPIQPLTNDATGSSDMAPFVSITSPRFDRVEIGAAVAIRAPASDKSGVTNVSIHVDGVKQVADTAAPYEFTWTVPPATGVTYTLMARAYDGDGNSTTSSIQVLAVDSTPPVINLVKPATNRVAAGATAEIRAEASDTSGVDTVEFYIDGALRQTEHIWPYQYFWPVPAQTGVSYTIQAVAYDANGNTGTDTLQVAATDLTPPLVTITRPSTNCVAVSTLTEVRAETSDDTSGIDRVEFYIDGELRQTEQLLPYQYFWPVPAPTGVTYVLTAVAFDASGNSATDSVQVVALPGFDVFVLQITNGAQRGARGDPDGDGYANLLEYVTGGNPTGADAVARVNCTWTGGVLALQFTRHTNATDATILVERSTGLTNNAPWTGLATNRTGSWGGAAHVTETGALSPRNVTVRDLAPAATNRFLRLRVTRP